MKRIYSLFFDSYNQSHQLQMALSHFTFHFILYFDCLYIVSHFVYLVDWFSVIFVVFCFRVPLFFYSLSIPFESYWMDDWHKLSPIIGKWMVWQSNVCFILFVLSCIDSWYSRINTNWFQLLFSFHFEMKQNVVTVCFSLSLYPSLYFYLSSHLMYVRFFVCATDYFVFCVYVCLGTRAPDRITKANVIRTRWEHEKTIGNGSN